MARVSSLAVSLPREIWPEEGSTRQSPTRSSAAPAVPFSAFSEGFRAFQAGIRTFQSPRGYRKPSWPPFSRGGELAINSLGRLVKFS
jgi:hypothetical protein